MSNQKLIKKTSKLLSLILRHQPEVIGITLDGNGWADVDELLMKISASKFPVDQQLLDEVVKTNNKKRFSFNEAKDKIRANQGHSIYVDVELQEQTPPYILYHGTVAKFMSPILKEGLLKMNRQHVHLSADKETALNVGSRRGKPELLIVDTKNAVADGLVFYLSENKVWLTDHVPAKYIRKE